MTDFRRKYEALVRALPEEDNRLLVCKIARWVLAKFKVEDPRLWEVVDVAERYAEGLATMEELRAARKAAEGAVRAVKDDAWAAMGDAGHAAWYAADAARDSAAWSAEDAALDAAECAARAVWYAAKDAARASAEHDSWYAVRTAAVAAGDAWDAAYKRFFEWALELMIGEKVSVAGGHHLKLDL